MSAWVVFSVAKYNILSAMFVFIVTHVEIQPEDEDEVAENVDGDEGDEDVALEAEEEVTTVTSEQRHHRVPDAHHAQDGQRQKHVLVLQM